ALVVACKNATDVSGNEPAEPASRIEETAADRQLAEKQPQQASQLDSASQPETSAQTGLPQRQPENPVTEPEQSIEAKKFLQEKGRGLDQFVVYYEREDLDRDGNDEIVVAFGSSADDY